MKTEAISGMHKDGRRFYVTVPHGMTRKQFLETKDADFDGETFGTKVERLKQHFNKTKLSDTSEKTPES